jgi:hypothetical protein
MTAAAAYLPPVLALVALSFFMALCILVTRFADLVKRRKPVSYYEDFDGVGASIAVMRPTRQLVNLFEFPVLFYAAIAILIGAGMRDGLLLNLCWIYVLLRWLHAISHLLLNKLWLRTPLFAAGNIALLCIWLRMSLVIFTQN